MSTTTSAGFISRQARSRAASPLSRASLAEKERRPALADLPVQPRSRRDLRDLVVAGLRGAAPAGGLEGLAAAAARHGVRITQREPAAHERVHEIDLGAPQVHGAHRVYDDAHAILVDDSVFLFLSFRAGHPVPEAGSATRG